MRKLFIALAALAAIGIALPVTAPADAAVTKKVIIKKSGHDRGMHRGWRNAHAQGKKVVIIKRSSRRHHHD
jgi:ABC-type nickel/cobalt efflux system permease component RcnA